MNRTLALSLTVLLGSAAWAQPKYSRKTKDIKVEQTERTKKLEKKEKTAAGPSPEITADQFFSVELKVQGDVDELIKTIDAEMRQIPKDDPLRFNYGFRLAEAYAQKQRLFHSQSMEAKINGERAKTPQEGQKCAEAAWGAPHLGHLAVAMSCWNRGELTRKVTSFHSPSCFFSLATISPLPFSKRAL